MSKRAISPPVSASRKAWTAAFLQRVQPANDHDDGDEHDIRQPAIADVPRCNAHRTLHTLCSNQHLGTIGLYLIRLVVASIVECRAGRESQVENPRGERFIEFNLPHL